MPNALMDAPALEANLLIGSEWNRRRFHVELPSPFSGTVDRQATYLRIIADTNGAVSATARTGLYTAQTAIVKFARIGGSLGVTRYFLQSTGDQAAIFGALPTKAYGVRINAGGSAPQLVKVIAGVETVLGTSAGVNPSTSGQFYNIRFQRTANQVQFRIWLDGASEPNTWDVQVTDSSIAAAGVFQLSAAASAYELDIASIQIINPAGVLNPKPFPMIFHSSGGGWLPAGECRRGQSDDALSSTVPTFVTSTALTYDSTKMRRILTAPGNGSAPAALTGYNVNGIESFRTNIRGVGLPGFSGVRLFLGFVNGASQWGIQQADNDLWATLVTPAGNVGMTGLDILNGGLAPIDLGVELHMRNGAGANGQLYIWMEDQLQWFADLAAAPSGTLVPTLTCTARTASSVTIAYAQFDEWLETQSTAS